MTAASSRFNTSQGNRPSSDSAFDPINDASHLTTGPSIQGNPFRSLLQRKKNRPSTPNSGGTASDTNASLGDLKKESDKSSSGKTAAPLKAYKTGCYDENQSKTNQTKLENNELRDEIQQWKKDHAL